MHKVSQSSFPGMASSGAYYGGSCKVAAPEDSTGDRFPAGLRVLVVDDDVICLRIVEQMLRRCSYHVTTCSQATGALDLLRERKGFFDVVLSDVYMPDMDGFKLLEHVGLEMDLPVIMMSADGSTNAVMKGVRHGACDYLIKPIREEELKNIWQHVVRKRWNGNKETEQSASLEDNDRHKRGSDDVDYASSVNEETEGTFKSQKKRSNPKEEDDGEFENDDPGTSKKPRVVWSVELHHQFVSAVNQLGIDKAVPKRILELMNVPGLTRENVASHLQKFRLYLKRLSMAQQGGISNSFCGPAELSKLGPLGRFDIQALAASGQIPSQTLAALHAELLGRPTGNLVLPAIDQPALLQASLQGSKGTSVEDVVPFGQLLMRSQSNTSKHFPQSVQDVPSGFGAWPSNALRTLGPNSNLEGLSTQNSNILKDILLQERQHQHKQQQQSLLPESSRSINVQPSCLVVPTQSSASFQGVNRSTSVNQNCNFNRSSVVDYRLLMPQPNNSSFSIGQTSDADTKPLVLLKGYQVPSSVSPSVSSCSANVDNSRQLLECPPNTCDVQGSYGVKIGENLDHGLLRNLGFVGKGTCIPSRFAVDELESPLSNQNPGKVYMEDDGIRVKQEPNLDFMENAKVGIPILQHYSPNDLMSVLTE